MFYKEESCRADSRRNIACELSVLSMTDKLQHKAVLTKQRGEEF